MDRMFVFVMRYRALLTSTVLVPTLLGAGKQRCMSENEDSEVALYVR